MILDDDKGKNNEKAGMENILTEAQPVFKIPNMVRRNNVWTIHGIERKDNEVMVVNTMGQLIFKASNYKNSVSIGNVATGIYFYQIKVIEKDNAVKYYTVIINSCIRSYHTIFNLYITSDINRLDNFCIYEIIGFVFFIFI
jgi:hypothetical protein